MTFANLDRVKLLLELDVPKLKTRDDYDTRLRRLMGVVHEKVRQKIVLANGGMMPLFLIRAAFTPPAAAVAVTALVNSPRRLRFRLKDAVDSELATAALIATVAGTIDGIATTEEVVLDRNGEFVTQNAFETISTPVVFTSIPATPGLVQVLEDADSVLGDVEDMMTACLFLREAVDRFQKDAQPGETDIWCRKATKLLEEWIENNLRTTILDHPLGLRAES